MKFKIAKSTEDINNCYKLRETIFVIGQNVPIERERDSDDKTAIHILLINDDNIPTGVGRIVIDYNTAIIGRLGIIKEYRGKGAGLFLMQNIIQYCEKHGFKKILLGAQEHALNFYKKLGFEIISEKYMDANIPHYKMVLDL